MKTISMLKDILSILAIACPAVWAIWTYIKTQRGDISWRALGKAVDALHKKMEDEKFRPDYIVCLGRAGGVVGAMLSHRFKKPVIPIIVLTFNYSLREHGKSHERQQKLLECCSIKDNVQNILLLGPDVMSGNTMLAGENELKKLNIKEYRTACLYRNPVSKLMPDFYVETRDKRLQYPWMPESFSEIYEDHHSLSSKNHKEIEG